jgi:hypothetical protein
MPVMRRHIARFIAIIPFVLALAWCGADLYEERLGNTRILFAHMQLLNEHLQGRWTDPETGVSLRPPLQFGLLAPPVKPQKPVDAQGKPVDGEADAEEEEVHDDRQPKYLNVELPGLRGAFQAKVKYIGDNNLDTVADAWLYVMTNHDLADQIEQAKSFNQDFVKSLAEAAHTSLPAPETFESLRFPAKVGAFVKPVKYTGVTINPTEFIDGAARQFSLYLYEQGDIQVVVLFVLPQNVATAERLSERIPLCLETLEVPGDRLSLPSSGNIGGGPTSAPSF